MIVDIQSSIISYLDFVSNLNIALDILNCLVFFSNIYNLLRILSIQISSFNILSIVLINLYFVFTQQKLLLKKSQNFKFCNNLIFNLLFFLLLLLLVIVLDSD